MESGPKPKGWGCRREPRLVLELPRTDGERWGEVLAVLAVVLAFAVVLWHWPQLPERVPVHIDGAGRVDGWGPRLSIWLLPVIGALTWLMLTAVARSPHRFNYPWPITVANAERQYRLARRLMIGLKAFLVAVFAYLALALCRAALGENLMGPWFPAVLLAGVLVLLVPYFVAARRAR